MLLRYQIIFVTQMTYHKEHMHANVHISLNTRLSCQPVLLDHVRSFMLPLDVYMPQSYISHNPHLPQSEWFFRKRRCSEWRGFTVYEWRKCLTACSHAQGIKKVATMVHHQIMLTKSDSQQYPAMLLQIQLQTRSRIQGIVPLSKRSVNKWVLLHYNKPQAVSILLPI